MELKQGYKQTEVGEIPEDWGVEALGVLTMIERGKFSARPRNDPKYYGGEIPFLQTGDVARSGGKISSFSQTLNSEGVAVSRVFPSRTLFFTIAANIGDVGIADFAAACPDSLVAISPKSPTEKRWLLYELARRKGDFETLSSPGAQLNINLEKLRPYLLPVPTPAEQRAIATALSDMDALLDGLERLIAKKRDLKQAAMQKLLTGDTRLPGFEGEWEVKTIEDSADCLDNVRVPLNEAQRSQMKGDIPYCGANGILDYVNDYVIDDDIILMAEDGGYFDEYEYRPIAYRMVGKCWVNNHAHILKAKPGFDQGFLFYSLVHKNILPFLASGTRAKLNKSELKKIEVNLPKEEAEQTVIATVLSDMDAEITALGQRRNKTKNIKQAMMQELLTGRTRLV
jgi:type I restriction enzyme, S subunit